MIYLLLSILSSTSLFVIFKYVDKYKIRTFDVIIINYIVASALGFLISDYSQDFFPFHTKPWFPYSLIIGILFIVMFVIIGKSSQRVGIAITTVTSKMSVIIPIALSIFIDINDELSILKASGILLALAGVFLTVYRKRRVDFHIQDIYLPIILFLGMGIVDSFVRFAQFNYVSDDISALFTAFLFAISALTGLVTNLLQKQSFKNLVKPATLFWGILLGIGNYGSIYFIIRTLNYRVDGGETIDGSVVFGINNIGIVALSVFIGLLVFRERLTRVNWIGIALSLGALYILSKVA
ncbi:MAG: hypothetical protein R6U66_04540 [Bacteroidales bacterium]|jgi:drug/metabolite transporter (DMT)-like permease